MAIKGRADGRQGSGEDTDRNAGPLVAHWLGIQHRTPAWRLVLAFAGGAAGILAVAVILQHWLGDGAAVPLLIAPVGASAVLLFAVPASPLAQPWAIIGGNTVSALCGIGCLMLTGNVTIAAPLAVGSAIAMMSLARCLHPPGGACALTAVIGGHAVVAAGWSFAVVPVAADSTVLVLAGLAWHAATRGNYPHRVPAPAAQASAATGYSIADIDAVLAQYDELLDVGSEDLDRLFRQVEGRAWRRLHGVIRCDQIMRRDVPRIAHDATIDQARAQFGASRLRGLPVIDATGHVKGLLGADALAHPGDAAVARSINTTPCTAPPETPIDELLPILSAGMHLEALVIDPQGRLLGMITQTDLLDALWRGHIAEQIALGSG